MYCAVKQCQTLDMAERSFVLPYEFNVGQSLFDRGDGSICSSD
jgi:hypothetical protein